MPFNMQTKRLLPRIDLSGAYIADMGTANTVHAIEVPEGAQGILLFFMKSDESAMVRGRVGFAGEDDSSTVLASDTDLTLGHHPPYFDTYNLDSWAKVIHIACPTANAKFFGAWCWR